MGHIHGVNIVREGLVFSIDAANPKSYISGSSDIINLKDTNITGSINNNLDFNSNNNGYWEFTGTQTANFGVLPSSMKPNLTSESITFSFWIRLTNLPASAATFYGVFSNDGTEGTKYYGINFNLTYTGKIGYRLGQGDGGGVNNRRGWNTSNAVLTLNKWHNQTVIIDSVTSAPTYYIDGSLYGGTYVESGNGTSIAYTTDSSPQPGILGEYGISGDPGEQLYADLSNMSIYNRSLSANEVLQNYEALKGRFIN
jgi:hypothetical protein